MRLFISVPLPKEVKKELAKTKKDFSAPIKDRESSTEVGKFPAKWVEEENLHITLVFIGEAEKTEATRVAEALTAATNGLKPINLKTDGLSLLPNEKNPHVLTVKLVGETEKLIVLTEEIKKGLREQEVNFDEKPFRPHVTLARLKRLRSDEKKNLKEKVHSYNLPEMRFKAERIELTESKLTPTGPIYFAVAKSGRMK